MVKELSKGMKMTEWHLFDTLLLPHVPSVQGDESHEQFKSSLSAAIGRGHSGKKTFIHFRIKKCYNDLIANIR